jgi:hypothetical protein
MDVNLEFLAEQQRRILDEMQKMRRDMQFVQNDYGMIRREFTTANLRFDSVEAKVQAIADEQHSQGVKLQIAIDQIDLIAQQLVKVLAALAARP